MESSKLVHIAAEVVLLGGITFYFNGQIKSLRNEIKELKTKYDEHTEAMNKHLNNVYALIDSKLNHANRPPHQFQPHPPVPEGLRHRRKPETPPKSSVQPSSSSPLPSRPQTPVENPSPEDLDEELGQELQELEEEEAQPDDELKAMDTESNPTSKKK